MSGRPQVLLCPDCETPLRQESSKMNVELDFCTEDHGVFLDRQDLGALVSDATVAQLQRIVAGSSVEGARCPTGHGRMRMTDINHVAAQGCTRCGGLWFRNRDLRAHVLEVRRRAYGEGSMAARADVMREAAAFSAPETVAGILTDFQLEHEL